MTAREEILARIRRAIGDQPPVVAPIIRDYRTADDLLPGDPSMLDLLAERLEDYKATVLRCTSADVRATVAHGLADALGQDPAATVAVAPGLPVDWRPGGAIEDDDRPAVDLARHAAAVTGVALAIAETGTLVLDGSPKSGRRALSLLPDALVCIVEADQVIGGMPAGLARLNPFAPLTMVSGPSATSDIELERVEGVHGPRTLIVVLVGTA